MATYTEIGVRSFGRGIFHKEPLSGADLGSKKVYRIRAGELVFNTVFAWEGAVALTSEFEIGKIGSHRFMTYQVNSEIADPRYLYYYFCSEPGLAVVASASPGSAGRNRTLGIKAFAAQTVELPDLDEQRRIVAKLEPALTSLHPATERSRRLRSGLDGSLLSAAFAAGGSTVKIVDVLELERIPVNVDLGATYRQVGIRSFGKGIFHRPPVSGSELSKLAYFEVLPNRLLFSNIMAWEGAIAVSRDSEEGFVGSQRFLSYRPRSCEVDLDYINYFFRSESGMHQVREGSTGSVKRNQTLSSGAIDRFELPLPPIAVQHRVVEFLNVHFRRLRSVTERRDRIIGALRPALLNAAFSGQL